MNAVNLLPAKHRPRTPTGGQSGSSYAVIGVLGALCVMVLLFVLTVNGINTSKESVAKTKVETAQAKKQAEQLTPYGNFIQVKEQRVSSVKQLATGRIDWERLTRGLAHVLPEDVWLMQADATSKGGSASGGSQSAAPSAPAQGGGAGGASAPGADPAAAGGGPSMTLVGCAGSHSSVAVTLVRLRHLPAVEDVQLAVVQKPDAPAGGQEGGGAPAASSGGAAGGAGGEDCGTLRKKPVHRWEAKVTFKPLAAPAPEKKVPAALGGGA
jgi:hypothetical protein